MNQFYYGTQQAAMNGSTAVTNAPNLQMQTAEYGLSSAIRDVLSQGNELRLIADNMRSSLGISNPSGDKIPDDASCPISALRHAFTKLQMAHADLTECLKHITS